VNGTDGWRPMMCGMYCLEHVFFFSVLPGVDRGTLLCPKLMEGRHHTARFGGPPKRSLLHVFIHGGFLERLGSVHPLLRTIGSDGMAAVFKQVSLEKCVEVMEFWDRSGPTHPRLFLWTNCGFLKLIGWQHNSPKVSPDTRS